MQQQLSPKQVARAIGVSEASVKRWCDKGILQATRTVGGHRRVLLNEVFRFIRESDQQLVGPEVLGLPATTGQGEGTRDRARERMEEALEAGDDERVRQIAFDLFLAGTKVVTICDEVLAPSFRSVGHHWEEGALEVYRERLACEITLRLLYQMEQALPAPGSEAPLAIGGTLEGDPYTLPTAMVQACLREAGWHARSLGTNHPVETLCAAIGEERPQLFWLSVSYLQVDEHFLAQFATLSQAANKARIPLVVGGRTLTAQLREQMRYAAFCDRLAHLIAFAQTVSAAHQPSASRSPLEPSGPSA
jgi:methanogenic corrinoid protein MtbC1